MSLCPHCHTSALEKPDNNHPAYLICPSCQAIQLLYEPMDYQEAVHSIPYTTTEGTIDIQVVGVFGGYGSGKSRSSLQEIFLRAMENPGGTGLLTAPTLQQLKRTTLKTFFNEIIPPPLIERWNKQDGELELVNGFVFYVIPSDDEDKLRSINAGLIHIEEASGIKRTVYDQLLTRCRDKFVKNRMVMVCSNPDNGWIADVIYRNANRANPNHPEHEDYNRLIHCFVWPTNLNKHLPPDYIELNSKGKPKWWIEKFLKGSMEHSEGMVYPNFARTQRTSDEFEKWLFETHTLEQIGPRDEYGIPKKWERFTNLDHGLTNPTAFYMSAIDPITGTVITYYEHYEANKLVPHHASVILPEIEKIPPGKLIFQVADPSIKNKSNPINGQSVLFLYEEYGIYFEPGNNSIEAGIIRVNSYIERGKWIVLSDKCPNLCREHINYKFPELSMDDMDENRDEKPEKKNEHSCDSMRYGFMRLPEDPEMLKAESAEPPSKYKRNQIEDEDDYEYDSMEKGWLSYV